MRIGRGVGAGHGIIPARMPGVTAQQSFYGQPATHADTAAANSFDRVAGTAGIKAAARAQQRADAELV